MGNYFDQFDGHDASAAGGNFFDQFDAGKASKPRNIASEVGTQLYAGATIDLPKMVGQAIQWMADGQPLATRGRELADWADQREQDNPDLAPQLEGRGLIGRGLSIGARSLAPSAAAAVPAIIASPLGAPAAIAAGAVSTAGLFGTAQAQDTYEKVLEAGGTDDDARKAGYINGLIEAGGEAIGSMAGMKLLGVGAKVLGKAGESVAQTAVRDVTESAVAKPFLKQLGETGLVESGTEFGQNAGEGLVERAYGVQNDQSPWEAGADGALAALGMTALLAPFGLGGFTVRAKHNERVASALENPDTDLPHRVAASKMVFNSIHEVDPEAAQAWAQNSSMAISQGLPISLDLANPTEKPAPTLALPAPGSVAMPMGDMASVDVDGVRSAGEADDAAFARDTDRDTEAVRAAAAFNAAGMPDEAEARVLGAGRELMAARQAEQQRSDQALRNLDGATTVDDAIAQAGLAADPSGAVRPVEMAIEQQRDSAARDQEIAKFLAPLQAERDRDARIRWEQSQIVPDARNQQGDEQIAQAADEASRAALLGEPDGQPTVGAALERAMPSDLTGMPSPQLSALARMARDPARRQAAQVEIDRRANEAATSQQNNLPEPTEAQREAGNFKMGRLKWNGMDISVEFPKGAERNGQPSPAHYGYIRRTEGADGEKFDVYVGPDPESQKVFVVDQAHADTRAFDEHKAMLNFSSQEAAVEAYHQAFKDGRGGERMGAVTEMTADQFKDWVQSGKATEPLAYKQAQQGESEHADALRRMASEAGWAEVGGRLLRDGAGASRDEIAAGWGPQTGNVTGRTKWLPHAAWYAQMRTELGAAGLSGRSKITKAIEAHLAGEKLSARQQRTVDWMTQNLHAEGDFHAQQAAEQEQASLAITAEHYGIPTEGLSPEQIREAVALRQATEKRLEQLEADEEFRLEREAIQAENLAAEDENDGIPGFDDEEQGLGQSESAPGRGNETPGKDQEREAAPEIPGTAQRAPEGNRDPSAQRQDQEGGVAPSLDLEQQSPEDLKAKAAQAEDTAAEEKAIADREAALPLELQPQTQEREQGQQGDLLGARDLANQPARKRETPEPGGLFAKPTEMSAADHLRAAADKMEGKAAGAKIDDFGEKIGGARKDVWASFKDKIKVAQKTDISVEPLSKSWPVPDYQALLDAGADPWGVAFMHAARDAVPAKPRAGWKLKSWASNAKALRDTAFDLANGAISTERARKMLAELARHSRGMDEIAGRIELYELVGHSKSLDGVRISVGEYSLYDGQQYDPPKTIWSIEKKVAATAFSNWPRQLATGATKSEAMANFKEKYDSLEISPPANKETSFDIYSQQGTNGYFVVKKMGRNIIKLAGPFQSIKEAREYKADNQAELLAKLEKAKEIPSERRDTNQPRVGEDMRGGQDVTPQMFGDAFGFKGVQFGNWVEQGRRQQDLNDAYDALMDMAAILNLPPKALSLNGELGLAFGARGGGGTLAAKAHYEPGSVVINLTKREGAGSLGHELWHAFDNYFSRMRGKDGYMTEALDVSLASRGSQYVHQGAVRKEMIDAFGEVVGAIRKTALQARSSVLDSKRTKDYWTTGREMSARSFESYLISKLQDQNASNDYLANIVDEATWKAAESLGWELDDSYPYPTAGEIPAIRAGFDQFFQTLETKETDKGVAMFSRGDFKRGTPNTGVHIDDLRALSKAIKLAYPIRAAASIDEWPADLRKLVQDAPHNEGIDAAFFDGQIWLAGDRLPDLDTAENRILHEGAHGGLRGLFGDRLDAQLIRIHQGNPMVRERVAQMRQDMPGLPIVEATEEVLVDMAADGEATKLKGWDKFVAWVRDWLRAHGFKIAEKFTDNDVLHLLQRAASVAEGKKAGKSEYDGYSAFSTAPAAGEPKFSRGPAPWVKRQNAAAQEALKKAGVIHSPPTLKSRVSEWTKDWKKRTIQGMVDQFEPLKEVSYKAYMLARLSKGADAALEAVLNFGTIKLDADGAVDVNFEKGGFLGIMSKLNGEHDRFLAWVIGNRAERLKTEGRENNFTDQDITELKALSHGKMDDGRSRAQEYAKARVDLDRYNKSVLDVAERAGMIDGAARRVWEKDFYVPFYRVMEDEQAKGPINYSGLVNQYAFKQLKGGEQELGDPLENVLRNWSHLIGASLKNQAARESLLAAEKVGAAIEAPEETARNMAKSIGNKRGVVSFVDQGKARWFVLEDPFMLDALKSIGFSGFQGAGMKVAQKFKRWLTMGVTVSPTFRIRNVIRDSLSMIGANPASYNVLQNVLVGWKGTKEGSEDFAKIIAGGGVMRFGTALEGDRAEHVKRLIEAGIDDKTILDTPGKVKAALTEAWDWWQKIGDRAENINRVALYKTLREQGKTHLEASFAARDTMDFSMQGTWAAIRVLTQVVPFMNARLQGLYKLGRGAAEDPRRFGIVVGASALASIALMMAYWDDDDWKAREDWDRETYWWFKVGDKAFRIPKPFEIGAIATIAERGLEAMTSQEFTGKDFASRVYSIISQQLSMNPVPQVAMPMIELWANKDSFTDRAIETMGMERLSKSERTGPGTSATAQLLGKNGVISPVQIDHLVSGYFGWLGTHVVATADLALRPAMGLPGKPAYRADDLFVLGDFVKDLPAYQSKYVTKLYEQAKEVQEAMADMRNYQKMGATEKAHEVLVEQGDKIKLYALFSHAEKQLADVNRRIKMVQTRSGDADAKRVQLDALYAARDRIAKITVERARQRQSAAQ